MFIKNDLFKIYEKAGVSLFYERLKNLSEERGTTLTAVVMALGVGKGVMSQWKSGSSPTAKMVIKFADYFGVSADFLLGRTDTTNPMVISGKKKEPVEGLIYREDYFMNKEAWQNLRSAQKYFLKIWKAIGGEGSEAHFSEISHLSETLLKDTELAFEVDALQATRVLLKRWASSNFEIPPTEAKLFSLLKASERFKFLTEEELIDFEFYIRGYIYEMNNANKAQASEANYKAGA